MNHKRVGTAAAGEAADDIDITDAIRMTLRGQLRRTGVTAIRLLKHARDLPDGLDARAVNRWISGIIRRADRGHIDYVIGRWAKCPDDPGRTTSDGRKLSKRGARHPALGELWIEVTEAMAAQLRGELDRTGITCAAILRGVDDVSAGLNQRVIRGWLYRETRTTNAAHWEFVINRLRAMPARQSMTSSSSLAENDAR